MIFRQLTHDDLGCASYLIGDEDAGVAAVVDPRLDIDEYLRLARYMGVRIEHVLETHTHADHVSGHGRLVSATGARIHIHRDAEPDYEHEPFEDGWELKLGAVRVRAPSSFSTARSGRAMSPTNRLSPVSTAHGSPPRSVSKSANAVCSGRWPGVCSARTRSEPSSSSQPSSNGSCS